jgi:hypothetical protein
MVCGGPIGGAACGICIGGMLKTGGGAGLFGIGCGIAMGGGG